MCLYSLAYCGDFIMKLDERVLWCSKQEKGIKIVEPNENLCKAYLKKANESLKSMNANLNLGLREWVITTAYYARYNAVYALLMKCGIKSEIHECTIAVIKFLFPNFVKLNTFKELEMSKRQRINIQYYTNTLIDERSFEFNVRSAPKFVLDMEKLIDSITKSQINELRDKLKRLIGVL